MSPKRPSKQKRAAQNRSQRAARAERVQNANAPSASARPATAAPTSSSLLSRLRTGGTPSGGRARAGSFATARARGAAVRATQPPGYRAALSAVFAAGAAVMLCVVALRYPVDAHGDVYTGETLSADWAVTALRATVDHTDATPREVAASIDDWAPGRERETVATALWPFSAAIVLPLAGAGLGFQAVRRRASGKVVNRALYATLFGAVLTQGLLMLFLPVVVAMGVAMYQVRKAEAAATASPGPGVIDVDDVDVDR